MDLQAKNLKIAVRIFIEFLNHVIRYAKMSQFTYGREHHIILRIEEFRKMLVEFCLKFK